MLNNSDGKNSFHANLSNFITISDKHFFLWFPRRQLLTETWTKMRSRVLKITIIAAMVFLLTFHNIAKPHVSLWKNDWRLGTGEWKPPICHFPSADKYLPKTDMRGSLVEYSEKLNLMWSSRHKIWLAFLSPKYRFLTPKIS